MTLIASLPAVDRATFYKAALVFAQELTGGPLKDLPLGIKGDSEDCPLARATGWYVDHFGAECPKTKQRITLPPLVQRFIQLHDKGMYPELVDPTDAEPAFGWN